MKPTIPTVPPLAEPSEAEIQKIAYRLWVEGGCQQGVESDNWFAAKELLRHHRAHEAGPAKKPRKAPASAPTSAADPASPLATAND